MMRCGVSVGGLLIVHRLPALHAFKTRRPGGVKAMDNYNLAADLLATFRASPDIIKALWLIVPPGFAFVVLKLLLSGRKAARLPAKIIDQGAATPSTAQLDLEPFAITHLSAPNLACVIDQPLRDRRD